MNDPPAWNDDFDRLRPRRIDLLTAISGVDFERAWSTRTEVPLHGRTLPVLGYDALGGARGLDLTPLTSRTRQYHHGYMRLLRAFAGTRHDGTEEGRPPC